jgi:hypothetical protein
MGEAGDDVEDCCRTVNAAPRKRSVLLNHHLGSFDYSSNSIALFEFEFVSTATGDGALDQIISDANDDMGHDVAELNFFDLTAQFVAS